MRTIKFRAWDKRGKIMCKEEIDDLIIIRDGEVIISDRFVLMQYIARKDINGKNIFESDIVKGNDFKGVVKFINFMWQVHRLDADGEVEEWFIISDYPVEVIGNIYENPELLDKSQKGE